MSTLAQLKNANELVAAYELKVATLEGKLTAARAALEQARADRAACVLTLDATAQAALPNAPAGG